MNFWFIYSNLLMIIGWLILPIVGPLLILLIVADVCAHSIFIGVALIIMSLARGEPLKLFFPIIFSVIIVVFCKE